MDEMKNVELEATNINRHIVADIYGIKNAEFYDNIDNMKIVIIEAARKAKMNIVGEVFKKFNPQGSSGIILLSESHLSYHFWPEYAFASFDIFCCGHEGDPQIALNYILDMLEPDMEKSKIIHLDRSFSIGK